MTLQASTTSGCSTERLSDGVKQRARGEEQLDQGLGLIAERGVIDDRREAPQRAARAQLVDPPFDRRRGERDVLGDVVVGAPAILDQ